MANLNKIMLIGRLTRDPESIEVRGQTAGCKFGFAVNNRKKNESSGEWEEIPVFVDCEAWNRGDNKQADRIASTLRKGQQVFIEGHLKMDQWEDKNGGGKRTALRVVVDNFQYLERKEDGGAAPPARQSSAAAPARPSGYSAPAAAGGDEDIPFAWLAPWIGIALAAAGIAC